jgi:hypothetical protein
MPQGPGLPWSGRAERLTKGAGIKNNNASMNSLIPFRINPVLLFFV